MGASAHEMPAVAARLKREDCRQTKHDSCFSKWQVLIGASDWEDYSEGKDGAWRYRVHSLPTSSGPGLYELGVAVSRSGLGRYVGKLDPDDIAVAYIGQADNVRSRLQHYGRSGAHLSRSRHSTSQWDETSDGCADKGAGLFEEIFSRGCSIVYRWASMKDKWDAEKTEAQLLGTFDYAWNKGSNGTRRPGDILQKLHKIASRTTTRFPNIAKTLHSFRRGDQVGIKIEASKPLSPEDPDEDSQSFLSGIFKFSRSQPRLVSDKCVISDNFSVVCGYILNNGTYCRMPPVPRRKRCEEHKGMRVYGSRSKSDVSSDSSIQIQNDQEIQQANICGVNFGGGTFCQNPAVAGRKRCGEHKGMRINSFISKSAAEDKLDPPSITSVFSSCDDRSGNNNGSSSKIYDPQSSNSCSVEEHFPSICGATLGNDSYCRRQPVSSIQIQNDQEIQQANICGVNFGGGTFCQNPAVAGRKRCGEHKGMRINSFISKSAAEDKFDPPSVTSVFSSCDDRSGNNNGSSSKIYDPQSSNSCSVEEHFPSICGATLGNDSYCRRQPVQENKRCWQHKGKRADSAFSGSTGNSIARLSNTFTCNVMLQDGSICMRAPVPGRKRCEQHKGMRVTTSYCY